MKPKMEFDIENIHLDNLNINSSHKYIKTTMSKPMINDYYNVTPIISQISNFKGNVRTQSLITLSDVTSMNSNNYSRHSINVCKNNIEKSLSNDTYLFLKDLVEKSYDKALTPQPQVLFNAPKRYKKLRRKQLPFTVPKRKFQRYTRLVKVRIVHCKYKHPDKNLTRKLESYYNKTKRNVSNPRRIQQDLRLDSVLKAVSRTRILKKVIATANLLEKADDTFLKDLNHDKILDINASEDTLTRINSESSQNDSIATRTVPSVVEIASRVSAKSPTSTHTLIQIQSDTTELSKTSKEIDYLKDGQIPPKNNYKRPKNEPTFNTNMISVAVAQIDNLSILKYKTGTSSEQSRENVLYQETLTSAESLITDTIDITSSLETSGKDANCIVLTDMVNSFDNNSSSDTFIVAKTSSYFKENSDSLDISSEQTLTPSSDLTNQTEPCNVNYYQPNRKEEVKATLLDTIINVGIFQMPVTSSVKVQSNDVIVTDELGKMKLQNKVQPTIKYTKNVCQKSCSVDNEGDRTKNINLPNEDTIRSIITESEKTDKKSCSEEFRNYVPPLEMWDKIIVYFDMTFKRLEDSLVNKISNEIKESLSKFEKIFPFPLDEHAFLEPGTRLYNKINESDVSKMESGRLNYLDEGMQCGLVQNQVIDELSAKIRFEGDIVDDFSIKLIESRVKNAKKVTDSFEVLKSPVKPSVSLDIGKGDFLLTSSSEGVRVNKIVDIRSANHLVTYITAPIRFLKANMLVITSVPAFFISIFLVYRFFVLLT